MRIYVDESVTVTDVIDVDDLIPIEFAPVLVLMQRKRFRDQGMRYYYAAHPPTLAIVVAWGQPLEAYRGQVVDVSLGWDQGWPRFVLPGNEGRRHTKVTIRKSLPGLGPEDAERTLVEILMSAPRTRSGGGP